MIRVSPLEDIPLRRTSRKEHVGDRYYGDGLIPIPEKEEVPVEILFNRLGIKFGIERYKNLSNGLVIKQWLGTILLDQCHTSGLTFIGQVKIYVDRESDDPYCILVDAVGRRLKVEFTPARP